MAILTTGNTFVDGNQVTALKLNDAVNGATFASGAVNNAQGTAIASGAIIVIDGGIGEAKLESGTNGQLFIGNGTGFTKGVLTAGAGIAITNASAAITVSAASLGASPAQDFFVIMDNTDATGKTFQKSTGFVAAGGDITFSTSNELTAGYFKATNASGSVTAKFYKDVNGVQLLTTQAAAEANVTVTSSIVGSDTVDESTVLASVNALENKVNALLAKLRTHGIIAT
jgi:hypothetical protein